MANTWPNLLGSWIRTTKVLLLGFGPALVPAGLVAQGLATGPAGGEAAPQIEVARVRFEPVIDGDLGEWESLPATILIERPEQVVEGRDPWVGPADASAKLCCAYDANLLYIAGIVRDDAVVSRGGPASGARADAIELFLGGAGEEGDGSAAAGSALRAEDLHLWLAPWNSARPWLVLDPKLGTPRQGGSAMTGLSVAGRDLGGGAHSFEVAIPFHQLTGLRPGQHTLGCSVVLVDVDSDPATPTRLSWTGVDPLTGRGFARLQFAGDGPLVSELPAHLLTVELLADLRYLLPPLFAVAALWLLARMWPSVQKRVPWLRPWLLTAGVALFGIGVLLPSLWLDLRDRGQRRELSGATAAVRGLVEKLEQGTLASYRGASRDRALMDLLAGKAVARQKYTSYRFLSQIADAEFGGPVREYPDEQFAVRPYWLPLERGRAETFHFDPPLQGEELYVVVGRPIGSSPLLQTGIAAPLHLEFELNHGSVGAVSETLQFDEGFVPGDAFGRELSEVHWGRLPLQQPLRTLGVTLTQGTDLRLVGLSLLRARAEPVEPLFLGTASLDGVLTDLRGPYPQDAGLELGPGATRRVTVPPLGEPCQKLWLFYRAVYPGVPTANPGAKVAEVVLHFRGGVPARTLVLEHQVSVFYELVVHNTRDQPPDGSPAAIAFSWVDEQKERHINTVLPVGELPPGAEIEAIEFRNLADYRMRFRSVVFGSEKAAAPQDPEDSPLVREGQDRRLRDDVRRALAGTAICIYRDGRLSESTLLPEQRQDLMTLSRDASAHADASNPLVVGLAGGGHRATVYAPLTGDGWDGAVLAVAVTDLDRAAAGETASRTGLGLCLVAAPLLLVLFSELLAMLANLRARLMTVLTVAALVPLVVLSIALAQVLERGHESDQEDGMRRQVQNATGQLADQMQRLRASAQQWQADLAQLYAQRLGNAGTGQLGERVAAVLPALQQLMTGQLPPEWKGGFLKLDWNPMPPGSAETQSTLAGDPRLAATEAPARLEPGVYVHWGSVVVAVRSESNVRGGTLALTVARPLGADVLGALAPGAAVMLCDTRGFPLEVAGAGIEPHLLMTHGRDPAVMAQRERALFAALDQRQSVVERHTSAFGEWLCGCEALRDLQETPRALLVLAQPDLPATLDLSIGRIPVRAFFLLVGGLLFVLSAFLSFVVSSRISRPVELLERSAQSLARGELDTRVPVEEGGQLGQLSRTFNQMAADLQGRLFDLQRLNRAMRDLSAQLDTNHALAVLRRFCEQHLPVDRVRVALIEPDGAKVELHGGAEMERCDLAPELAFLPAAVGPFSLWWPAHGAPSLLSRLPGIRSVIGFPLLPGGRCRGAVLLGFESLRPRAIDLDLLTTVVAQAAVALDNAQLYRHAVQDPVTGAFAPDYFRRRAAEEVALAQQRSQSLALLGLGLGDGAGRPRGLRRFALVLREHLPRSALLCHAGSGQFQLLAPGLDRPGAEVLVLRILEAWQRVVDQAPESDIEDKRPTIALAMFPEEAASAEFLFDALRDRMASGSALSPAAVEVDASLQRAGITAVSPVMREVYRTLRRVAPTDLAVLFLGETGSGKEVLTNLVHRWSRRSAGPLVKVHCAALTETLLASELFGHEKGAFTGADRRKIGKFEQANGGTIFLDEVGEIPLDVQVKLLRVLQEREVDRVGGVDPVAVDVRVVAATNRNLERMVVEGRFREDLYYRLQGIVVTVPPLRDRRQEIPALVEQFRSEVVAAGESRVHAFTTDAMDELFRRDWPGNIRELRNAVHRAMVLAASDVVERRDVLAALPASAVAGPGMPASVTAAPAPAAAGVSQSVPQPIVPPVAQSAPSGLPAAPASSAAAPGSGGTAQEDRGTGAAPQRDLAVDRTQPAAVATRGGGQDAGDVLLVPAPRPQARPDDTERAVAALTPRVRELYQRLLAAGSIGTQDHVSTAHVSQRTGLRDLQALVDAGLVERIGSRRGARYRPTNQP